MSNDHLDKWRVMAPLGLTCIGAGLSMVGEAIIRKRDGRPWFAFGTLALIVVNAGISIFGDAVKHRALYEHESKG